MLTVCTLYFFLFSKLWSFLKRPVMLFKEFNFDTNVSKILKKPSKVRCSGKEQIISSWFFCERNRLLCKSIAVAIPVYYFLSGNSPSNAKVAFISPEGFFSLFFLFYFLLFLFITWLWHYGTTCKPEPGELPF